MKKILSALLACTLIGAMVFAFAGCSNSLDEAEKGESKTNSTANSAAKSTAKSTADEAKPSKGELHMATNAFFPPYEYYEEDKIVGIDAEIAKAICDKLGYDLVIDDMEFDSIITAVQSGKADFGMAGMTVTDERKEAIDFTDTYANAIQVIIVKEGSDKVKSADDLAKATVGVQLGTTGDLYVSKIEGCNVDQYSKGNDAVLALTQGKVDAVVIDNEPAKAFVAANEGLTILEEPFENEDYAICVAKNSDLTEQINGALKELKADGTIQSIIDKYIK